MKNILIIGSGGREHAIAKKIAEDGDCKIFSVPGNPGMAEISRCVSLDIMDNDTIISFCKEQDIDLVAVGPENPLANGIVDELEKEGIKAFGPSASGARFEASKDFTKSFMKRYDIPTGDSKSFTDLSAAVTYIKEEISEKGLPIVIKADGLAAGKGVIVAKTEKEAIEFTMDCLEGERFGDSGNRIVVEEFLEGEEASYLVFTDGESYVPMVISQDHKPIGEGDKGPNTGGMGAYSPAKVLDSYEDELKEKFVEPFLKGIKQEGIDFRGVLYMGLMKMKDGSGLKVLEYNCRFGDPETQVILPRLKTPLVKIMEAVADKRLSEVEVKWDDKACATIVLASGGYPGKYEKGKIIEGLEEAESIPGIHLIHAGTKKTEEGIITDGGRVLNVVSQGEDLKETLEKAYNAVEHIRFEDMYFRKDIGKKGL